MNTHIKSYKIIAVIAGTILILAVAFLFFFSSEKENSTYSQNGSQFNSSSIPKNLMSFNGTIIEISDNSITVRGIMRNNSTDGSLYDLEKEIQFFISEQTLIMDQGKESTQIDKSNLVRTKEVIVKTDKIIDIDTQSATAKFIFVK